MSPISRSDISGLILAGGRAQRMQGCDKGLVEFRGSPMIGHVIRRLQSQLELIRINANRNQPAYAALGSSCGAERSPPFEVVSDTLEGFQGPLAGIARGLQNCPTPWLLVVPCDTPLLPHDLVWRMAQQAVQDGAQIAVADDGQRLHPVVCLLKRELHASLIEYLAGGDRKIDRWYAKHPWCRVDFSDQPEAFVNINSLQDKQQLENHVV